MIVLVRQNSAVGDKLGYGRYAGQVRHVAGGEDKCRLLAMQIGELALKLEEGVTGPGYIARAAGAHTKPDCGLYHGADHLRVLAHSEVIVGAPDNDFATACRRVADGVRKTAGDALEVGKHAVAPFVSQTVQSAGEIRVIVHGWNRGGRAPIAFAAYRVGEKRLGPNCGDRLPIAQTARPCFRLAFSQLIKDERKAAVSAPIY